jgi:hypothetical protein
VFNPNRPSTPNLTNLLKQARSDTEDHSTHAVIADALDEEHPGTPISELIRKQYGFGVHGGQGAQGVRDDFAPFYNSFDGTFPFHARLGRHGPFNLYLAHNPEDHNSRWVVRAISRLPGSNDSGYSFEFPYERAHEIPRMFPAAEKYIDKRELGSSSWAPMQDRRDEARRFEERMDAEEAARG